MSDTAPNDAGVPTQAESKLNPTKKIQFTILLIGETGAGKTSFMSLLVNLFQGMGPLELSDKHDESKESGLDRQFSQTTKAMLYTVTAADGTKIRILDTPGLADTRGIEKDNEHKAEINRAIKEFVSSIDAVVIMANGTVVRLGAATDYTLNVITSMFPSSIIDNIGFIFTNSDVLTFNFKMDSLQLELRESKYWLIQNPLAIYKNYDSQVKAGASQQVLKALRRKLEDNYDETVETLNEFMKWLDERKLQPVKEINELYQMSVSIESNIEATLSAITHLAERRAKIEKIKSNLGDTEKSKAALEELKRQQEAPVWDRQKSDKVNTICIAPNCYKNCHSPCSWDFMEKPADLARRCAIFPEGPTPPGGDEARICEVCNHEASAHRHYFHIHVQKPREMDAKTRKELEEAKTKEEELHIAENLAQSELNQISKKMDKAQEETRRLVENYNKISLSKNFAGHIRSAIAMLEFRKKGLESKPNTESELKLINDSIAAFQKKLGLLQKEAAESKQGIVSKVKGVIMSVVA
ncbi:hypothetical protein AX16_006322 [Volvariella volvacea WC 439]|nr:hypothetical protein AX16_006322 [Volvariella volvacea WC 439]